VTGTVTAPKHYVVRSDAHLNDVLIQAIPTLSADISHVEIAHGGPGQAKSTETVNYLSYLNDKTEAGNPRLRDFDVVNVPQKKDAQPIQINIQGQVAKPGRFAVPINTTAYAALQDAGDITPTADRERISIKHSGQTEETPLQYAQAREHIDDVSVNPVLLDGDTIIVNALPIPTTVGPNGVSIPTNTYTLTGPGIHNQAEYKLDGPSISLDRAIALAGGLSDRAKVDQIQITRSTANGGSSILKLDARDPVKRRAFQVLPGDSINIDQGSPPRTVDPFQLIGLGLALFGIFGHR
jgi:protein involved in polysaccharide export with SLBB domain